MFCTCSYFWIKASFKQKDFCAWNGHTFWVSSYTMAPKKVLKTMKKNKDLEQSPKKTGEEKSSNQKGLDKSSGRKGLEKFMKKPGCNDGDGLEKIRNHQRKGESCSWGGWGWCRPGCCNLAWPYGGGYTWELEAANNFYWFCRQAFGKSALTLGQACRSWKRLPTCLTPCGLGKGFGLQVAQTWNSKKVTLCFGKSKPKWLAMPWKKRKAQVIWLPKHWIAKRWHCALEKALAMPWKRQKAHTHTEFGKGLWVLEKISSLWPWKRLWLGCSGVAHLWNGALEKASPSSWQCLGKGKKPHIISMAVGFRKKKSWWHWKPGKRLCGKEFVCHCGYSTMPLPTTFGIQVVPPFHVDKEHGATCVGQWGGLIGYLGKGISPADLRKDAFWRCLGKGIHTACLGQCKTGFMRHVLEKAWEGRLVYSTWQKTGAIQLQLSDIGFFLIFFLILSSYVSWFSILEILILHLIKCSKNDTLLLWYLPLKNQYLILFFEPHQFKILILTNMQCSGLCTENYGKNARRNADTHTLCEPAQSKRMSRFHKRHFIRNLQEKIRGPEWAPWSSTGLYTYLKKPAVWTVFGEQLWFSAIF